MKWIIKEGSWKAYHIIYLRPSILKYQAITKNVANTPNKEVNIDD